MFVFMPALPSCTGIATEGIYKHQPALLDSCMHVNCQAIEAGPPH